MIFFLSNFYNDLGNLMNNSDENLRKQRDNHTRENIRKEHETLTNVCTLIDQQLKNLESE